MRRGICAALLAACWVSACGDDDYRHHADWGQLSFPVGVTAAEPVEKPSGVSPEYVLSSVAVGPPGTDRVELVRELAEHLESNGWAIRGAKLAERGFFANAPDSIDVVSVVPLPAERERLRDDYGQRIAGLAATLGGANRAVLIRLAPPEQDPF